MRRKRHSKVLVVCATCKAEFLKHVSQINKTSTNYCSRSCLAPIGNITTQDGFWKMVEKSDGCWIWSGNISHRKGYGDLILFGKPTRSHRAAWLLTFGEIPEGLGVCHRCDNPPCCNPDHLFLGTNGDNNRDKVKKGRQPRGSDLSNLTEQDVLDIKAKMDSGKSQHEIGKEYGVCQGTISHIKTGKTWRHV